MFVRLRPAASRSSCQRAPEADRARVAEPRVGERERVVGDLLGEPRAELRRHVAALEQVGGERAVEAGIVDERVARVERVGSAPESSRSSEARCASCCSTRAMAASTAAGRFASSPRATSRSARSMSSGTYAPADGSGWSACCGAGAGEAHARPSTASAAASAGPADLLAEAITVHPQRESEEGLEPARRLDALGRPVLVRDGLVEARGRARELLEGRRIEAQALRRVPLDPTPGVTPFHDPRQHAVSLAFVVPVAGDCAPQNDALDLSWLTPDQALDPGIQAEMDRGHGVLLRQALAHLGHPV